MRRGVGVALFCVAVLVVATACSGGGPGASDPPDGDSGGTAGVMSPGDYVSGSGSTFPLVADTVVRLGITDGEVAMSAGCNSLGSSYRLDGDVLVVGDVASTMMGCADDLADQDARLAAFLESRPVVSLSPDGFTWTATDGTTLVFVERAVADPDRPLEGTAWVLDAVVDAEAAVAAVGFDTVTLVFDDGTVSVSTGCSQGQSTYTLDGDSDGDSDGIVLGPLALTPVSAGDCTDGVIEAEAALVAVFGGTATATVRADLLELRRDGTGLNLRAG